MILKILDAVSGQSFRLASGQISPVCFVGGFGLRNKNRFSEGRFLIVHPYSSANAQALVRASSSGSPGGKISS